MAGHTGIRMRVGVKRIWLILKNRHTNSPRRRLRGGGVFKHPREDLYYITSMGHINVKSLLGTITPDPVWSLLNTHEKGPGLGPRWLF